MPFRTKSTALAIAVVSTCLAAGVPTISSYLGLKSSSASTASPIDAIYVEETSNEPIQPLPAPPQLDERKVSLGKRLFHETRLSADNTVSCSSCHNTSHGGADNSPVSLGIFKSKGKINAPSVYNSALNFAQFWDGRAQTLEEQALVPLQNRHEMGMTLEGAVAVLTNDPIYRKDFQDAFGSEPTAASIGAAIAEFERSLLTSDAPIDSFLRGDDSAISDDAKHGYQLFKSYGCVACHQGRNIGGNMFQRFGIMGDYFSDRGSITDEDLGRFNVTHKESDRHVFKVPSLRNVELTAPYFHDGSAATLEQAVVVMGRYQLGRQLSPADIHDLTAFLRTLTGAQPK